MTAKRACRVCGKEYEACNCRDKAVGVFRWQDVACSPVCGSIYLEQIIASRTKGTVPQGDATITSFAETTEGIFTSNKKDR